MKKLIGIMVVLSMVMMASVAFADPAQYSSADSSVQITVAPYAAIVGLPGNLVMTVNDIQATSGGSPVMGEGSHEATATYTAQGNTGYSIILTVDARTGSVIGTDGAPGSGSGAMYPTAYVREGGAIVMVNGIAQGIGYGISLNGIGWNHAPDGTTTDITATMAEGTTTGTIKINTYLDSGRSDLAGHAGGFLARPGLYTGVVTLTVAVQQ